MPFTCAATGEMAMNFEHSSILVETSPKTLCSITYVKAQSEATGQEERWLWKEPHELTPEERALFQKMSEEGLTIARLEQK